MPEQTASPTETALIAAFAAGFDLAIDRPQISRRDFNVAVRAHVATAVGPVSPDADDAAHGLTREPEENLHVRRADGMDLCEYDDEDWPCAAAQRLTEENPDA